MIRSRGRRIALLGAALSGGLLAAALVAGREAIVERYYIFKLGSADEATRLTAADKLVDMKSAAAVPRLIALLRHEPREEVEHIPRGAVVKSAGDREGRVQRAETHRMTPIAHAIYRLGSEALPAIEEAIKDLCPAQSPGARGDCLQGMVAAIDALYLPARDPLSILRRIAAARRGNPFPLGVTAGHPGVERVGYRLPPWVER